MTQPSNVVELPVGRSSPDGTRRDPPPLLQHIRDMARQGLSRLLGQFFDNLDDALFELADRSRSDADQQLYFESMRELRIARQSVERDFIDELDNRICSLADARASGPVGAAGSQGYETLSLVRNDDLEISVAIAGIVSKITSRFSLPLAQLTRRLDAVCPRQEVRESDNPLGPKHLCECFIVATQTIQLDIKVRIILLKLFERLVVEQMAPILDDANRMLADAGVLRNLKDAVRTRPSTSPRDPRTQNTSGVTAAGPGAAGGAAGYSGNHVPHGSPSAHGGFSAGAYYDGGSNGMELAGWHPDLLGNLGLSQSLLAPLRNNISFAGASGGGTPLNGQDLLNAIAAAQLEQANAPLDLDHVPSRIDLRPIIVDRASIAGAKTPGLSGADEDVVNLVGMLFDYILNDRNLAIPMKALLGRLQIPFLKVALIDKRFFTQTSNPARQLLNELSSAGIGWSNSAELKRDALYDLIESIVLRVLNRFDRDLHIFQTLLDELRGYRTQDERRNKVVEQRIRDAEIGRAKARAARDTVAKLIKRKAHGLELASDVGEFIREAWSKVLLFVCIRHGAEGKEWQGAVDTLDELMWCAQSLSSAHDIEERDRLLPRLMSQLQDGVTLIAADPAAVQRLRLTLEIRGAEDTALLRGTEPEQRVVTEKAVFIATEGEVPTRPSVEVAPEIIAKVAALQAGAWLEFQQPNGEPLRAKLTAILEEGQRFIFVNRRGMKVTEKDRAELALDMLNGRVLIVDERQLFERALERVIGTLREKQVHA